VQIHPAALELDREQLRMLHGLLEARWSIDHPDQ
jgi:hypothetical protein